MKSGNGATRQHRVRRHVLQVRAGLDDRVESLRLGLSWSHRTLACAAYSRKKTCSSSLKPSSGPTPSKSSK